MEPIKPWYQSRTIWASIVTVGAAVAALFGLPVGEADQIMLADKMLQLVTVIGGLAAIFGRVIAKSQIA
jgi:hypothetical protein